MKVAADNITAIVLTYGSRWDFANNCIRHLRRQGVVRIVLVVNSSEDVRDRYAADSELIFMGRNSGSAAGFRAGLEYVRSKYPESFVWLFDDDNYPQDGCVDALVRNISKYANCTDRLFLAYRVDRPLYRRLAETLDPSLVFSPSDRFRSFDVFEYTAKILKPKGVSKPKDFPVILPVAPYGGLCFHISLIDRVGFPDERYVFYCDDYDYTRRMSLSGISIEFMPQVKVGDSEISWNMGGNAVFSMLKSSKIVLYYSIRNTIFFERKYRMKSSLRYSVNALIYSAIFAAFAVLLLRPSYLCVYLRGVLDGFSGRMGISGKYPL